MIVRQTVHIAALVLAAGIYLVHGDGPFIYDDIPYIVENEDLRQLWPPAWLNPGGGAHAQVNGRPLTGLSLALNYALGGLEVGGYHLANAVFHLMCALALYGLLRRVLVLAGVARLSERAADLAFCSSLLWLVHPLNSEVVYYTVQRSSALMGALYLATLYALVRSLAGDGRWRALALICCAAGMAAKEVMVGAPLVVLALDRALAGGSPLAVLRRRPWFYVGLAAGWLVLLRALWHRPHKDTIGFSYGVDSWTYLLNQAEAIAHYMGLFFWPQPLALDYGSPRSLGFADIWWQGGLVVGLLVVAGWALWRQPLWGVAGLVFFSALAPTSSFIPILNEVAAERRMYLPSAALVVLLVVGGYLLLEKYRCADRRAAAVVACIVFVLAWTAVRRGADYASTEAIWRSAVAAQPANGRAYVNLGAALQERGAVRKAISQYRRAVELMPVSATVHYNLGSALQESGDLPAAVDQYRRALMLQPDYPAALLNLGQVQRAQGADAAAEDLYRRALRLTPERAEIHASLGKLFFARGQYDSAAARFRQAIDIAPQSAEGYNSLGTALAMQGHYREAANYFRRALAIDPAYARARVNLERARSEQARAGQGVF